MRIQHGRRESESSLSERRRTAVLGIGVVKCEGKVGASVPVADGQVLERNLVVPRRHARRVERDERERGAGQLPDGARRTGGKEGDVAEGKGEGVRSGRKGGNAVRKEGAKLGNLVKDQTLELRGLTNSRGAQPLGRVSHFVAGLHRSAAADEQKGITKLTTVDNSREQSKVHK